jgi:hypothetical protein
METIFSVNSMATAHCTKRGDFSPAWVGASRSLRGRSPMLRLIWLLLVWLWTTPLHAQIAAHILLQDSPLAGFQYHAGKTLWPQMQVGDALALIREPDNRYDAKAVRVAWRGHKIGYVPRRENSDVARFMDGGQPLVARISRLAEGRDPWSRVRFEILIPVQPGGQRAP